MESIYLLIPLSIGLVALAVWAFFWAVNKGQFEDLDGPSRLALEEDTREEDTREENTLEEDTSVSEDAKSDRA